MASPKRVLSRLALVFALGLSLALPSFGQASGVVVEGRILVPSGGTPRPQRCFHTLVGDPLQGTTGWVLETTPGRSFVLSALSDIAGQDDFDIYFFSALPACQDPAAAVGFTTQGDEAGTVPPDAKIATVVLSVGIPGAEFRYAEGDAPASREPSSENIGTFEPKPASDPVYGTKPPWDDPDRQEKFLEGADGISIYVETWLPALKEGISPPERVPTILIATPYASKGSEAYPGSPGFIEYMTSRGFAVAQQHIRGTGESGGCLEQTSDKQIDDGARIIEYLGRDAPWSNGNVGMYGISYDAETQLSVAGRGDPSKTKYLKAIVPAASVGGQYEYSNRDGVPFDLHGFESNLSYLTVSAWPGTSPIENNYPSKFECQQEMLIEPFDMSGDMRPFWKVREYRPDAANIRAATLWVHGFADFNVEPVAISGYFDRLPASTPKKGLFGIWNHAFPSSHSAIEPTWARADWLPMVTAWYDRYLKNIPNDVESWPTVQVQSSDGTWRAETEFPTAGGPAGQLALGPNGKLGDASPTGSTSYVEVNSGEPPDETNRAVFQTEPMSSLLRITGQPVADLWIESSEPDAHIVAELELIDPRGEPARYRRNSGIFSPIFGSDGQIVSTYGLRSIQHLDPMPENYFIQEISKPAPVNTPIRVLVRMLPTDIAVPKDHSLRLTIAGTTTLGKASTPSGAGSTIRVLHDCETPSTLRFLMPTPDAPVLNVREVEETGPLKSEPRPIGVADGAGMATSSVCGKGPVRVAFLASSKDSASLDQQPMATFAPAPASAPVDRPQRPQVGPQPPSLGPPPQADPNVAPDDPATASPLSLPRSGEPEGGPLTGMAGKLALAATIVALAGSLMLVRYLRARS